MKTEKGEIAFFGPLLVVRGYADPQDLYLDLSKFFRTLRPAKTNALGRTYPETTVADVRQVIDLFNDRIRRAKTDTSMVRDAIAGWRAFVAVHDATIALARISLTSVDPHNDRLWTHVLRRLSARLSTERDTRPADKTLVGSFVDSAAALPGRVVDVVTGGADGVSDAAGSVADAAGVAVDKLVDVVEDAGRFAKGNLPRMPAFPDPSKWLAELKWPLIIGAGIVGGVALLPYLSDRRGQS